MSSIKTIISNFRGKKVLVIGDIILDQHIYGNVSRISPEAPVPVVLQIKDPVYAPGGAANVANNLRSLGASVTMAGRVGTDPEGKLLQETLRKRRISTRGIVADRRIPTIVKTRIIAQHQQVLRLDRERLGGQEDARFLRRSQHFLEQNIKKFNAVIISDYGKGVVTPELVQCVRNLTVENDMVLTVDPKVEHFAYYRGATAITPNRKEAENAIRNIKITQIGRRSLAIHSDRLQTYADVERAAKQLLRYLDLQSIMITLGEEGMCLVEKGKKPVHIHTRAREVFDVTGAGDTVIAVFTLALVAGASKLQAADLANDAAGIVVGKVGAVPVRPEELLAATKT